MRYFHKIIRSARCAGLVVIGTGVIAANCLAQSVPFDSGRWTIEAAESRTEEYLGRESLLLKGGIAYVEDSEFLDGIIEFDMAFNRDRGFMGAVWHLQGGGNYEEFYVRPHQSGFPDANQYTPVFNGVSGWQLYHAGFGAPIEYSFDEWFHVKIVVSGKRAEVYIVDMDTPALFIDELKHGATAGKVGLSVGNFAPCHYADFTFTSVDAPALKGKPHDREAARAGTVMSWWVSTTFDEKSLEDKTELTAGDKGALKWTRLDCEESGVANLARVQGIAEGKNCAIARATIVSDKDQVKKVEFGYSDRIKVYCNDRLIYSGSNFYRSRDYRYLGTIGYFDALYLPFKKGENELWMAVSESFGGWGVTARLVDTQGVAVKED